MAHHAIFIGLRLQLPGNQDKADDQNLQEYFIHKSSLTILSNIVS
jgi:hypothetical protein